jgi:putative ABC transport system permease protein
MKNRTQWGLAIRLFLRDWKGGETGVLLGALIVSVAAMSAVGLFTDRVMQAVTQQAGEMLAADLRLESSYPLPEQYEDQANELSLSTAEVIQFRSVVLAGDLSSLSDIRGVSAGYPLRGEVRIADQLADVPYVASGIPLPGEVWAEPSLLVRLNLMVGDTVQVGDLALRVSKTLEFRPDEGWRLMELAPTLLLNISDIEKTGLIQPGSRVEYELLFAGNQREVNSFRGVLEELMGPDESLDDVSDAQPEVRSSITQAERFLTLSALVSVLLGGVAVAMSARRYLVRHLDDVALMKCLGAQHSDILNLILAQFMILTIIAAMLGSLVGFLAQHGLTFLLDGLVEAELPNPVISSFFMGPITALTVAFGFALPPLLQLKNVPPVRVLRNDLEIPPMSYMLVYGTAMATVVVMLCWLFRDIQLIGYLFLGTLGTLAALYFSGYLLVSGAQRFRGSVGIAWRYGIANVARRGKESSIQIVAFGVGLTVLLLLTIVRTELMTEWQSTLPETAPNHFAINIQPNERETFERVLIENGIESPVFAPLVRARISHVNGVPLSQYEAKDEAAEEELNDDLNISWSATLNPDNELVDGEWWDESTSEPQLSLEWEELEDMGLLLGDRLTFSVAGESVTARITSTRRINWDSFSPNFFMVVNPGLMEGFAHTYITSFYLEPEKRATALSLTSAMPGVSVIDIDAVLDQVKRAMGSAALAVQYVFLFTLAAGVMVLLAAIQSTRDERMYESAVLRTLGAGRKVILQGVAAEFIALGVIAGILAATSAGALGIFLSREFFDLVYLPGPLLGLYGLLIGAVVVGVSGTLATRSVVSEPPVSTLRSI